MCRLGAVVRPPPNDAVVPGDARVALCSPPHLSLCLGCTWSCGCRGIQLDIKKHNNTICDTACKLSIGPAPRLGGRMWLSDTRATTEIHLSPDDPQRIPSVLARGCGFMHPEMASSRTHSIIRGPISLSVMITGYIQQFRL